MKKSYYTLKARLVPAWNLPEHKSLKIERREPDATEAKLANLMWEGSGSQPMVDLKGRVSTQPIDAKHWPDPPHEFLANLGYDSDPRGDGVASDEDIIRFTRFYGLITSKTTGLNEDTFVCSLASWRAKQRDLREAWRKQDASLYSNPPWFAASIGKATGFNPSSVLEAEYNPPELRPTHCDAYIRILLQRDIAEGRAKVCLRPDCPHPYFVATKKDAKYCSHKPCANVVMQRNLRGRQKQAKKKTKKRRKP